ncbi:MAG: hypothetical protein ABIQ49_00085 [Gemmatimonadales bacterium]
MPPRCAAWVREGLVKRFARVLWLERRVAERGGPLTESVLKLLRQHAHQTLDPQGQIEAPAPGYLGCQDTYYVGTLKGVGRVYARPSSTPMPPWASPSSISARSR